MSIGNITRIIRNGTPLAVVLTLALALLPFGASAQQETYPEGMSVCNTASHGSRGGDLMVDSADPQAPVHYTDGLRAKNNGSMTAAMHSKALSLCSVPGADDAGGTGGGTT